MENSEILGFQFEPTKALQPDPSSGENWETCSLVDGEPSATRQNQASVDTWCLCFNCSQIKNEGVLVLSRIRLVKILQNNKVVRLFTPNSADFLYQTNQ